MRRVQNRFTKTALNSCVTKHRPYTLYTSLSWITLLPTRWEKEINGGSSKLSRFLCKYPFHHFPKSKINGPYHYYRKPQTHCLEYKTRKQYFWQLTINKLQSRVQAYTDRWGNTLPFISLNLTMHEEQDFMTIDFDIIRKKLIWWKNIYLWSIATSSWSVSRTKSTKSLSS